MARAQAPVQAPSRLEARHVEEIYRTGRTLIRSLCVGFCVWCFFWAIRTFAGQSTSVLFNGGLTVLADFRFEFTLTLAGGAAAWAVIERQLRQHTTERLHARVKELETQIDEKRSSSKLTPKGKTNPIDRLT